MALNLGKVVVDYLATHPEQKFSARQIAEWIFETYPAECQEKRSNSRGAYIKTDADLVQQLVAEISSQRPRLQKRNPEALRGRINTIGREIGRDSSPKPCVWAC